MECSSQHSCKKRLHLTQVNSDTLPNSGVRWCNRWLSELKEYARKAVWETAPLLGSVLQAKDSFPLGLYALFSLHTTHNMLRWMGIFSFTWRNVKSQPHTARKLQEWWFWMLPHGKVVSKEEIYIRTFTLHKYYGKNPNPLHLSFSASIWLYISN